MRRGGRTDATSQGACTCVLLALVAGHELTSGALGGIDTESKGASAGNTNIRGVGAGTGASLRGVLAAEASVAPVLSAVPVVIAVGVRGLALVVGHVARVRNASITQRAGLVSLRASTSDSIALGHLAIRSSALGGVGADTTSTAGINGAGLRIVTNIGGGTACRGEDTVEKEGHHYVISSQYQMGIYAAPVLREHSPV